MSKLYRFNVCVRICAIGLALGGLCFSAAYGVAHETVQELPTDAQLARVEAPMVGSVEFARQMLTHLRNRFDGTQMATLDSVASRLMQSEQIRWGQTTDGKPNVAEYHRWRAEKDLLELLGSFQDVIKLNFRRGTPEHDPDETIQLDPQYNLVLLKVTTGDGPTCFRIQSWDLIAEYPLSSFKVNVNKSGTTFVLLKLKSIPEDGVVSTLAFQEDGNDEPAYWHALRFATKSWGHLAVEVRDENDRPTPVLMQIASQQGNRIWEPPGAVDLRGQLNDVVPHLSQLGRGYMFFLPGKNRGRYWIVPGPLEMELPEGKWNITILHGPEYEPIQKTIDIKADQWNRKTYRLKRWISMSESGWYSGDDHVHARLTSSEDAQNLMHYTRAVDINVANILEMGDPMRTYYAQRGFGKDFRMQHEDHWLIPGQEDPRSELGHAIGLNLTNKVRDLDRYLLNDWLAEEIHRQGGLYGHTHMGANACFVHREMAIFTPMEIVDFNSIMQASLGTELYYDMLNLGFKMTASAGADTPYGGTIGAVRVYAHVGEEREFTPDLWFDALKRGNTFVTNGPMLEFRVEGKLPGEEIKADVDQKVQVYAKASGLPGTSAPHQLQVVCLGKTLRQVTSKNGESTLELNFTHPTGHGLWLAAHAIGVDGSEAHSTPIYLKCDEFRHWNHRRAPHLIQKQLAALDETEAALAKSEQLVESTASRLDYWNRLNASQADQVRLRLESARKFYQQLQDVVEAERPSRESQPLSN